jgi:hypothetical protein
MKKRLIEEQIIGFLREADAGHPLRCSANVLALALRARIVLACAEGLDNKVLTPTEN